MPKQLFTIMPAYVEIIVPPDEEDQRHEEIDELGGVANASNWPRPLRQPARWRVKKQRIARQTWKRKQRDENLV